MTHDNGLGVHVQVALMRPVTDPAAEAARIRPTWAPCSSTLSAGETEALLVDTLITFHQVDALADWIKGSGKRLVGVLVTQGHSDRWIGLSRLQEHFPGLHGFATKDVLARAQLEAANLGSYCREYSAARSPPTRYCPNSSRLTGSPSTAAHSTSSTSARETSNTPHVLSAVGHADLRPNDAMVTEVPLTTAHGKGGRRLDRGQRQEPDRHLRQENVQEGEVTDVRKGELARAV